jgi:hypothetical protein
MIRYRMVLRAIIQTYGRFWTVGAVVPSSANSLGRILRLSRANGLSGLPEKVSCLGQHDIAVFS